MPSALPISAPAAAPPPAVPIAAPALLAYRNVALAPVSQTARHLLAQLVTYHPPRPDLLLRLSLAQLCALSGRGRTQTYAALAELGRHGFLHSTRLGRAPLLAYGPSVSAAVPAPTLTAADTIILPLTPDSRPVLKLPDVRKSGFPDERTKAVSKLVRRTAVSAFSTRTETATARTPEGTLFQAALVRPWPDTLDTAHHWPTERQRLREAAERNPAWQSDAEHAVYEIAVGLLAWAFCTARQIAAGKSVAQPVGYTYSPWAKGRTPPLEDHTAAKAAWNEQQGLG